jgi:hypothetical protein
MTLLGPISIMIKVNNDASKRTKDLQGESTGVMIGGYMSVLTSGTVPPPHQDKVI